MASFTLLYDLIRWEEKAIVDAAKKKGVQANLVDARELTLEATGKSKGIPDHLVLERCVSHYRNIHAPKHM